MTQLMLITGPSGSGKTTLSEDLVRALPEVMKFVTDTTRDVRPGERHGEDYYFNRPEDFQKRINWNDFFEYQEVFKDKFYGFSRRELERFKRYEKTPIAAADVEGTLKFMRKIDRGFIDLT